MGQTLTKFAQKRSRAGRWSWAGERVGLILLQLFPSSRAMEIVFVTLFCIEAGTAIAWCCGHCAMPDGHRRSILLFLHWSTAALVFWVGACFELSLFCSPLSHSSPSLTGLLTCVDVKQQSLSPHEVQILLLHHLANTAHVSAPVALPWGDSVLSHELCTLWLGFVCTVVVLKSLHTPSAC